MRIGGIILILFGLNMLNILKIPFLNQEKLLQLKGKPIGLMGSFVIGVTFSLGWTPCIGPVLASILLIASTSSSVAQGGYLLSLYSLGLAIPFFIAALLVGRLLLPHAKIWLDHEVLILRDRRAACSSSGFCWRRATIRGSAHGC